MHETTDAHRAQRLKIAIGLTASTLVAEVAGGLWTNSLALLSDAAHVFLDLFALVLSLAAIRLAMLPANEEHSFGWHRAEVFASFINGVTVFLMAAAIFYEALKRLVSPQEVDSLPMFIIAAVGLVANGLSAVALHTHSHDDLNVRSAFVHVIGDAAASVGVIIGGIIMYVTRWYVLDALISMGIGIIIFTGAFRVLRESVHILMEGVPRGMNITEVAETIRGVKGVRDLHHLNVWAICSHITALSVHLDIDPGSGQEASAILRDIERVLLERHNITHTTLQIECTACANGPVIKEFSH
ncbi:MAG TPA: cation diffusion facilitator family transporter [Deltaproteobacteria bacterium]|nr:cation diffusion facilitator family transporter [Deltaproteobacteria bacterium]HPP81781.1 cation diffusion facilitator family transporter [Deltaproteobacteria bacterium]